MLTREPVIGDMRNDAQIMAPSSTPDEFGSKPITYTAGTPFPCAVETLATRDTHDETFTADQLQAQASVKITCRYRTDISTQSIVKTIGRYFNVYNIDNYKGRNEWLLVYGHEFRFDPNGSPD